MSVYLDSYRAAYAAAREQGYDSETAADIAAMTAERAADIAGEFDY